MLLIKPNRAVSGQKKEERMIKKDVNKAVKGSDALVPLEQIDGAHMTWYQNDPSKSS